MNTSLTYEILMYLNSFYFGMFATCEIGMGTLKAVNLDYTKTKLTQESLVLVFLCLLESVRIYLGKKGSLSDHGKKFYILISVTLITFIFFRMASDCICVPDNPMSSWCSLPTVSTIPHIKAGIHFVCLDVDPTHHRIIVSFN